MDGWLGWLECCSMHQRVTVLTPSQGTYLGCRFDPWLVRAHTGGNQLMFLSLFLSLSNQVRIFKKLEKEQTKFKSSIRKKIIKIRTLINKAITK